MEGTTLVQLDEAGEPQIDMPARLHPDLRGGWRDASCDNRTTAAAVSGHFDDPASDTCRIESDGQPIDERIARLLCRTSFVVTEVER